MSKKNNLIILILISLCLLFAGSNVVYAAGTPPLVTFISDDGYSQDVTYLKPLSDKYNIPFTTAIITNELGTGSFMTLDQLNMLYATGRWEFVSHTMTHPHLTTLSSAQLDQQLKGSQDWLKSQNLGTGYQYLVYPYGEFDNNVMDATMKYYKLGITTEQYLNSTQMNPAKINRITLGAFALPGMDNAAYYESQVDEAIANGQWLVFTMHTGSTGHNNADLEAVIQYIQSKNVPIVTVSKAMEYYTPAAYVASPTKRVEENNQSISYSGTWTNESYSSLSAGSELYAGASGASASFSFTGTGIKLISTPFPSRGIAKVTLDGTVYNVDEYWPSLLWQNVVFEKTDLAAGTHSIKIECSGTKNAVSTSNNIFIDAFDIINGDIQSPVASLALVAAKRVEENNPSISYSGTWARESYTNLSTGSEVYAGASGASASFYFTGTGIKFISTPYTSRGIVKITVDGTAYSVDPYSTKLLWQNVVFQKTGLAAGNHSIKIECSGTKNVSSSSTNIFIDAFDIINGDIKAPAAAVTKRVEENNPSISYSGTWANESYSSLSAGSELYTGASGASASFSFTGTGIKLISTPYTSRGIVKITLDGTVYSVDTYSTKLLWQNVVFQKTDLAAGTHNIKIQCSGTKNSSSTSANIFIDAFDIVNGNIN
jgi:peptidoglycan/xylan/chitin deacetylase (PgdA/CDA1 family)